MFFYLLFGCPVLAVVSIVFFLVCLVSYLVAKRKNREIADPALRKPLTIRKTLLIVSSIIMGVMLVISLSLIVLFCFAIAHM